MNNKLTICIISWWIISDCLLVRMLQLANAKQFLQALWFKPSSCLCLFSCFFGVLFFIDIRKSWIDSFNSCYSLVLNKQINTLYIIIIFDGELGTVELLFILTYIINDQFMLFSKSPSFHLYLFAFSSLAFLFF